MLNGEAVPLPSPRPPKFLDQVRNAFRRKHYSRRTEDAYVSWTRRYIVFHGMTHPAELDEAHVTAFLTHLAVHERVSASTQNQALAALLFCTARSSVATSAAWARQPEPARRSACPL